MYLTELIDAKHTIQKQGYYRYQIYQDYYLEEGEEIPEEGKLFILDNCIPECWAQRIVLKELEGEGVHEAYLGEADSRLNTILFDKIVEVFFSADGKILKMNVMVDAELYKVLETVWREKNYGFALEITDEFVERPYWKEFETWTLKAENPGYFAQEEAKLRQLIEDMEITPAPICFDETSTKVSEEEDVLANFPEWICLYHRDGVKGRLVRFGYAKETYLDRVLEPVLMADHKEMRLKCGEEVEIYTVTWDSWIWASMEYMAPIRIEAKFAEDADGKPVLTIIRVELYKSDTLKDYINQYFVGMDNVTEEDLLEFFELQV